MKIIDLFSGLGGWGASFKDRNHEVLSVDIEPRFKPDLLADVRNLIKEDFDFQPTAIFASPPCNCFSVASIRHYWENGVPKNDKVRNDIRLVYQTLGLIYSLNPRYWVLENPRGMMRRILGKPTQVTYFASWGKKIKKPTDLWGVFPEIYFPPPKDWIKAPRGTRLGVQGIKGADERAKIPYDLSMAFCLGIENEIKKKGF